MEANQTKDLKLFKPSNSQDHILSTVNPVPSLLETEIDIENCTYVSIRDGTLMGYISSYVGSYANSSFVITPKSSTVSIENLDDYYNEDECEIKFKTSKEVSNRTILTMGLGWHEIEYEDHKIKILYQILGNPVGAGNCVRMYEFFIILIEGRGKHHIIQNFCDYIIKLSEKTIENTFNVYQYNIDYSYWNKTTTKFSRPVESVILPSEIMKSLIQDIDDFLSRDTYNWYKMHGIPYKRSYLLYGPPGSGKSSIIQAIAGKYKRNVCFIQPINPKFTDDVFTTCIQSAPKRALIVMEDVDAYFGKNREILHSKCPLTFSGLLNALDGVGSSDGQIFILTTNFIDRLDDALIRSGRVDKKIEFQAVNPDLAYMMFLQFYPGDIFAANTFRKELYDRLFNDDNDDKVKLCMADLQQHFISYRNNNAIEAATKIGDITGEEYKLLLENAEKATKIEEDKNKKNKEVSTTTNNGYHGFMNYVVTGISATVGFGLILFGNILLNSKDKSFLNLLLKK